VSETKPYCIEKKVVLEAYRKVKANKGVAGVDKESLADFAVHLKDNLYRIWNRMSSGSYFPPPVKRVEIPKKDGKKRPLGIPTVGDRIAQMVVKMYLEPAVEPEFHPDSYGYRPGKSALDAVGTARKRCWRKDWVVDLDIKGFFDNIDHDLMLRAVKKTYRQQMDFAVHRKMAESAGGNAGWSDRGENQRNPARRGGKPTPGEYLSASCL
jgi:RNA-directed DNA polymerase